ncbi:DUF3333 domain-containing protein, partial [Accumulibacter sp.]
MSSSAPSDVALIRADIRRRKHRDLWFGALGVLALAFALLTVVTLFANMLIDGWARLTPEFLSSFPSRRAGQAGIL